jgi:hypothetical protein
VAVINTRIKIKKNKKKKPKFLIKTLLKDLILYTFENIAPIIDIGSLDGLHDAHDANG